jgi:phytol kinase
MNIQIIYTVLYLLGFYFIILVSEYIYHHHGIKAEITRKAAHVIGSLSSISFIYLFDSHWYVLIIGIVFFTLLFLSKRRGIYHSIDSIDRISIGSYLLPVSIYLCFLTSELFENSVYFLMPVLILGISDPLAALVGMNLKNARYIKILSWHSRKTLEGSLAFFVMTFLISTYILYYYSMSCFNSILSGIYIGVALTLIELFSSKGLDNITVPISTLFLIWLLL